MRGISFDVRDQEGNTLFGGIAHEANGALELVGAVERDTGLSKDTLRVWERRYGFPQPGRDGAGERLYPAEQVRRLRLIKRLMDQGHRPGRLLAATPEEV